MDFRVGALTDVGRVRDHNEDSFCVNRKANLYIVADGMGGHAAGEIASAQLKDLVEEFLLRDDHDGGTVERLCEGIRAANHAIHRMGVNDPRKRGMGTTGTVFTLDKDHYVIAHVGDSRCYLLREGELFQITKDHSRVYQLYESGLITKDEMEDHPMSNVITRSIGNHSTVDPDIYEGDLVAGDRFLLCSDGLSGEVRDEKLQELLVTHADPQACAEALVEAALEAGGKDNVTVVVLDVRGGQDERRQTKPMTLEELQQEPETQIGVTEQVVIETHSSKPKTDPRRPVLRDEEPSSDPGGSGRRARPAAPLWKSPWLVGPAILMAVGVTLILTAPRTGSLRINSERPNAEVYIDGIFEGKVPLVLQELKPKVVKVKVMADGKISTRQVEILPGLTQSLYFPRKDFQRGP